MQQRLARYSRGDIASKQSVRGVPQILQCAQEFRYRC